MAEVLEDTDFDYIVLGTGLIESILAGSLARSGKKVLHLDSEQNYGGNWRVFGFRELISWYLNNKKGNTLSPTEGDHRIDYEFNYLANFRNVQVNLYSSNLASSEIKSTKITEEDHRLIQKADQLIFDEFFQERSKKDASEFEKMGAFIRMMNKSRSYNFDTTPKLLGTREELVEILIKSGVGRYLEFKNVDDIYIYDNSSKFLEKVPSTKEDVFTNKTVALIEKRKLMKYLTFAMEFNIEDPLLKGTKNMTFADFLQDKFKISGKLQDAIVYAIALVDKSASVEIGLNQTHNFVSSMGRFGKAAYLCPLYGGASEIGQAFCRVCAVYGGVYMLNQQLDKFIVKNSECVGILSKEGTQYNCKKLISGIDYLNSSWFPDQKDYSIWISRAMILSTYNLNSEKLQEHVSDNLSYCVFPPGSNAGNTDAPIYGIYQNDETMACPKGEYITYLWTISKDTTVLEKAVELLSKKRSEDNRSEEAQIIMTVFYQQRSRSTNDFEATWKLPSNIIPCSDSDISINFKSSTEEARKSFYKCESVDTEFMPAAEQEEEEF